MPEPETILLAAHAIALVPLSLLGLHRAWLAWTWWRRAAPTRPAPPAEWPSVTVQLPIRNERYVVRRLVEAAGRLAYPADRLTIAVLDDSSDDTTAIAEEAVAELVARGLRASVVHRPEPSGYKAGALQGGLDLDTSELVAVFDADFVPEPDFLLRLVPWFADPEVGMAQARWGHLNAGESWLTSAQALLLDAHFAIEHAARHRSDRWFNFNGTAGIWRRAAIDAAGGWRADTLTEDLDLSYRAQLAGWRFVYDDDVVAPAELPATIAAFKAQQRRWARGSIQTARKMLPTIWRAPVARRKQVEATFHLVANLAYPLVVLLSLLLPFGLLTAPAARSWALGVGLVAAGTGSVALFYALAVAATDRRWPRLLDIPLAMALGAGMSISQGRAVFAGLRGPTGAFERTPKRGSSRSGGYTAPLDATMLLEGLLALWLLAGLAAALLSGSHALLPFLTLFTAGFLLVAGRSAQEALASRALAGAPDAPPA